MTDTEGVRVEILLERGHEALVEWQTARGPRRATIPRHALVRQHPADWHGTVAAATLREGAPYGVNWEALWEAAARRVEPAAFAAALRTRGFWTVEEVRARPAEALAALQAALGISLWELIRWAEQEPGEDQAKESHDE